MTQCRRVAWINNWTLQLYYNVSVPLGTNKLVLKGWMKRDHSGLQKMYVSWYSFGIFSECFARTFEYKQLPFPWSWSS